MKMSATDAMGLVGNISERLILRDDDRGVTPAIGMSVAPQTPKPTQATRFDFNG